MPRPTVACSGTCSRRVSAGWQWESSVYCGNCLLAALAARGAISRVEIRPDTVVWTVPTQAGF